MQMRIAGCIAVLAACTGVSETPDGVETLAALDQPGDVAVAGDDLYFIGGGSDPYELFRMSRHGGTPEVIARNAVIMTLAADETGVYWNSSDGGDGRIMARHVGATEPVELFVNPTWAWGSTYRNIVLDETSVYYVDQAGVVWQIPKLGGAATMLGTTDGHGSLALSPDGIWVATKTGAKLLPDGPHIEVAPGEEYPSDIAWTDGALFVSFSGSGDPDGFLLRVSMETGITELADRLVLPGELTAYGGYLYMTTGNLDSAIRRVPVSGGGSQALATGRWPSGIAIDDDYVYWSDWQNDRIRRLAH